MEIITLQTPSKEAFMNITALVQEKVTASGMKEGMVVLQSLHTTAGLTINENADPAVQEDLKKGLQVFNRNDYKHAEGNSDAHLKTSLVGPTLTVLVEHGQLVLGTWQGIYFAEFDGPRTRKIAVMLFPKQ